ncbi:MAG: HAMP domain-containing sensor histidine kinase [bacterium]|nr:HAMP domain-containing sensor histidine kinase [bacterium]
MVKMLKVYSKRFGESVIGFVDKYRFDPFFRTEVNIIGLQLLNLVFLLGVIGVAATTLYHDTSTTVSEGIQAALAPNASATSIVESVVAQITAMRSRTLMFAAGTIITTTILLSYVVTRMALAPVRNALESQKLFIGNVAHELRTPISIIKTNTEVSLMSPDVSIELKKTLESTIEELDRTSEIINNLLSLSASIKPERMEFKDVDFGEVVSHVMQQMEGLSEPKHLEIEVRMSERRTVHGNAIALEQVVMNIVKNAITHTPRNGRILVTVEPVHPNHMEFTVRDSGSGIPRKDLFRIFEPYYRGDPSRKRGGWGGGGLGLTIVSELVKLHNGKITVRSAEKRGTTVTVLLPAGGQDPDFEDARRQHENASEIAVDFSHNSPRNT